MKITKLKLKKIVSLVLALIIFLQINIISFAIPIAENVEIKIGCWGDTNFLFDTKNKNKISGYLPDYLAELNEFYQVSTEKTKLFTFSYVFGTTEELIEKLNNDEVDAIVGYSGYNDNPQYIETEPFAEIQMTICSNADNDDFSYMNNKNLQNQKIAYLLPTSLKIIEHYKNRHNISMEPVLYTSLEDVSSDMENDIIPLAILPFHDNNSKTKILDFPDITQLCFLMKADDEHTHILEETMHHFDATYPSMKMDLF